MTLESGIAAKQQKAYINNVCKVYFVGRVEILLGSRGSRILAHNG
jgi:hypothetical protein